MSNRKDRNRKIVSIYLMNIVIVFAGIKGAIKRGLNTDNYLIFGLLLTITIVATILLHRQIQELRRQNREEEDIRKQLND
jgi:hypothetical protein